jgi:hypothetical protein
MVVFHVLGFWLSLCTSRQQLGRVSISIGALLVHIAFITCPIGMMRHIGTEQPFWSIFKRKEARAVLCVAIISIPITAAGPILSLLPSLQIFLLVSRPLQRYSIRLTENLGTIYHSGCLELPLDPNPGLEVATKKTE